MICKHLFPFHAPNPKGSRHEEKWRTRRSGRLGSLPLDVALGLLGTPASGLTRGSWSSAILSSAGSGPVTTISIPRSTGSGTASSSEGTSRSTSNLPLALEARLDWASTDLVGAGHLGLLDTSRVLVLLGLGVAVEVQIS